ncbi:MAG: hypothetical protein ACKPJD_03300, partial [Planctomycetaceae bacterium]
LMVGGHSLAISATSAVASIRDGSSDVVISCSFAWIQQTFEFPELRDSSGRRCAASLVSRHKARTAPMHPDHHVAGAQS